MQNEIEKKFVQQFVIKSKRHRLLYELSGKKRQNGIRRFCHNTNDLLLNEKIISCGNQLFYYELIKIAQDNSASGLWYIIAYNKDIDRKSCELGDALNLVLGNGMAAIIISDTMAIVETEQCTGTPLRYILHC